jgi:hypothetical protein
MDSKILDPKTRTGIALYPDCVHVSRIGDYIYERTGVRVSQRRVNGWMRTGELLHMEVPPCASNRRHWTRKVWIDAVIEKYTCAEETPTQSGGLYIPRCPAPKPAFNFPPKSERKTTSD